MTIVPRKGRQERAANNRLPDEFQIKRVLQAMAQSRLAVPHAIEIKRLDAFSGIDLFPAELSAIAGAAPSRRATFEAGRGCARSALRELGSPDVAIPRAPSGAPIWPPGIVGSISHTNKVAAAIVASGQTVRGLGLDVETDDPLDDTAMLRIVCRPEEMFTGRDPADPANLDRGKLVFVIKEAVYKLYSPLADAFLEFEDLSVSVDEQKTTFRAMLINPKRPSITADQAITGVFASSEGLFMALASLAHPSE